MRARRRRPERSIFDGKTEEPSEAEGLYGRGDRLERAPEDLGAYVDAEDGLDVGVHRPRGGQSAPQRSNDRLPPGEMNANTTSSAKAATNRFR